MGTVSRTSISRRTVLDDGHAGVPVVDAPLTPLLYQRLVLSTGAVTQITLSGLTFTINGQPIPLGSIPASTPTTLYITFETAGARYTDDGTVPSATVGHPYAAGEHLSVTLTDVTKVQLIASAAGAIAHVTMYTS